MGILSYFANRFLYDAGRASARAVSRNLRGTPSERRHTNSLGSDKFDRARNEFRSVLDANYSMLLQKKLQLSNVSPNGLLDDAAWIEYWRDFGKVFLVPISNKYPGDISDRAWREVALPYLDRLGAAVDQQRRARAEVILSRHLAEATKAREEAAAQAEGSNGETVWLCRDCGHWVVAAKCYCGGEKPINAVLRPR